MAVYLPLVLLSCTEKVTNQDSEILFEKALANEKYDEAYACMCPEYKEKVSLEIFSKSVSENPYLNKMDSIVSGGSYTTQGGVSEYKCVVVTSYGYIPATLFIRDFQEGRCIMSMTVAGMPVIGFAGNIIR